MHLENTRADQGPVRGGISRHLAAKSPHGLFFCDLLFSFFSLPWCVITGIAVQRARAHKGPSNVKEPTRKCHVLHMHVCILGLLLRTAHTSMNWLCQAP
ncbi:hypothetical protein F5883DRAFT_258032 [Diaporthe sp. PMI_573]|nr:hypothetical protein F5883DRAFT_258032 [Diaporthaceae sp. PMI_573]